MELERGTLSRRGFLDRSLAALTISGIPMWYAREVLAEQQQREAGTEKAKKAGPNDQIVMAAIGVGGQGTGIMNAAKGKKGVKFVAVCDIDSDHVKKAAKKVGKVIAERAIKAGVSLVAFDRGGRRYHGRVKALADAAREGGLKF